MCWILATFRVSVVGSVEGKTSRYFVASETERRSSGEEAGLEVCHAVAVGEVPRRWKMAQAMTLRSEM